jgi:uncharacterized protein (DUF983 family)
MIARAMLLRCPRCGGRDVVHLWGRFSDACPTCGHRFESEEGYWLGAVAINTIGAIATFAFLFVGLTVATWPDVAWNAVLIVTVAVMALFPIVFYPWAKMLWVALDLKFRTPQDLP